jgi:hypothetical protein
LGISQPAPFIVAAREERHVVRAKISTERGDKRLPYARLPPIKIGVRE